MLAPIQFPSFALENTLSQDLSEPQQALETVKKLLNLLHQEGTIRNTPFNPDADPQRSPQIFASSLRVLQAITLLPSASNSFKEEAAQEISKLRTKQLPEEYASILLHSFLDPSQPITPHNAAQTLNQEIRKLGAPAKAAFKQKYQALERSELKLQEEQNKTNYEEKLDWNARQTQAFRARHWSARFFFPARMFWTDDGKHLRDEQNCWLSESYKGSSYFTQLWQGEFPDVDTRVPDYKVKLAELREEKKQIIQAIKLRFIHQTNRSAALAFLEATINKRSPNDLGFYERVPDLATLATEVFCPKTQETCDFLHGYALAAIADHQSNALTRPSPAFAASALVETTPEQVEQRLLEIFPYEFTMRTWGSIPLSKTPEGVLIARADLNEEQVIEKTELSIDLLLQLRQIGSPEQARLARRFLKSLTKPKVLEANPPLAQAVQTFRDRLQTIEELQARDASIPGLEEERQKLAPFAPKPPPSPEELDPNKKKSSQIPLFRKEPSTKENEHASFLPVIRRK